jgi:U3 small nucleolar RNA-associated protein 14
MGDDAAIAKREELAMSNLTIEEVAARRAELRHMRELMFRAETKAKRVAKIKSKTYRKIVRKEADRNAEKLAEAGFGEDEDELRIKKDRDRAIERATLKHKNTGKWAKAMLNKGDDLDIDQRRELNDQLQEGERLKQRIQGRGDGSESESSDDGGEEDLETLRERAFTEIDGIDQGPDEEIKTKSGLFQMKFMTDARKRAADHAEGAVDDFRREMDHIGAEDGEGPADDDEDDGPRQAFTTVGGNAGRQVYGQSVVTVRSRPSGSAYGQAADLPLLALLCCYSAWQIPKHVRPPASDVSTATLQSSNLSGSPPLAAAQPRPSFMISTEPESTANPWLTAGASSSKISRKKNAVSGKEASAAEKSVKTFKKSLGKVDEAREREQDDAMVDIDPSQVSLAPSRKTADKGKGRARVEEIEDEESEDDHERRGPLALRQRDLVAQAFAGDNVLEVRRRRRNSLFRLAFGLGADTSHDINAGLCRGEAQGGGPRQAAGRRYKSARLGTSPSTARLRASPSFADSLDSASSSSLRRARGAAVASRSQRRTRSTSSTCQASMSRNGATSRSRTSSSRRRKTRRRPST